MPSNDVDNDDYEQLNGIAKKRRVRPGGGAAAASTPAEAAKVTYTYRMLTWVTLLSTALTFVIASDIKARMVGEH